MYALRGVTGEEAMDAPDEDETLTEVDLPVVARVVGEGKRVDETSHPIRVTRIGRTRSRANAALPTTHSDLKLVVDFGDGGATGATSASPPASPPTASGRRRPDHAVFTSLAEADLDGSTVWSTPSPGAGAGSLSPRPAVTGTRLARLQ